MSDGGKRQERRWPIRLLCLGLLCLAAVPVLVRTPQLRPDAEGPSGFTASPRVTPAPLPKPVPARPAAAAAPAPAPTSAPDDGTLVVKRVLPIEGPLRFGQFVWDEAGVPPGPITVTVDLAAGTVSVFRGGYEIGATAMLYGADEKPTPLGVFPITEKDADHISNLYDAPMPYMLRLTNDGISVHGSDVKWGYATNGCIGVPVEFARRLFAQARIGDRVIITSGKRLGVGGVIAPG